MAADPRTHIAPGPKPPAPDGLPLVGHLWNFIDGRRLLPFLLKTGRTQGDICLLHVGVERIYLVNNPDFIQTVIQDQRFVRTPLSRRLLGAFLGESVFSQEGALHRQQRRLMQPAFHRDRLAAYADIMVEEAMGLRGAFREGEQRDVVDDMMRLTLDIVCRSLFGTSQGAEATRIKQAFHRIQASMNTTYALYTFLPDWFPMRFWGEAGRAVQALSEVTRKLVAERRAAGTDRGDLISMLLLAQDEDGSKMTDTQVAGQTLAMLFAGHETTANTLCWTWYLLSRYPEVRARLGAELAMLIRSAAPPRRCRIGPGASA